MEDGTVLALDEAISLSGEVSLTSVWDMLKEEIPAPAPAKQDEAEEDIADELDETPAAEVEEDIAAEINEQLARDKQRNLNTKSGTHGVLHPKNITTE